MVAVDRVLVHEGWVILAFAILPLGLQLLHALGHLDVDPLGIFVSGGRQNFLPLSFLFLGAGFPKRQTAAVLAAGAIAALSFLADPRQPLWLNLLACAGMAAFAMIAWNFWRGDRARARLTLAGAFPFSFLYLTAPGALALGAHASPWTLDGVLWDMEKNFLGGQVAFLWFRDLDRRWSGLREGLAFVYQALNLAAPLIAGVAIRYGFRKRSLPIFFLVSGSLAALLYPLAPASGPIYAEKIYGPAPPFGRLELPDVIPRNCIPSMHMTWALGLALISFELPNRFVRVLSVTFAVLTLLSTLSTGEHYVIDLVVAVPFTLMLFALLKTGAAPGLRAAAFAGHALTLGIWYLGLLTGYLPVMPGVVVWAALVATLAAAMVLDRRYSYLG